MEAQAATVEADESGFEELKNQLMQKSSQSGQENTEESREEDSAVEEKERSEPPRKSTSKKFVFRKGDEVYELDEDFKAVRQDIKLLGSFGFVELISSHKHGRERLRPVVDVDKLVINVNL